MEKKQSKFKEFVKKNKGIIIGTALLVGGGIIAAVAGTKFRNVEKVSNVNLSAEALQAEKDLLDYIASAHIPCSGMSIVEAGGYMIDYYNSRGVDLDNKVEELYVVLQK